MSTNYLKFPFILLSFFLLIFTISCSEDSESAPSILLTLNEPTEITAETASVSGSVEGEQVLLKGFVFGEMQNPTLDAEGAVSISSGSGAGAITAVLTGLEANTTYFVRAFANDLENVFYSDSKSFTTLLFDDPEPNALNVISIEPVDGSTNVDPNTNVLITFDERVDVFSNTQSNFSLKTPSEFFSEVVQLTTTGQNTVLTVNPDNPLVEGVEYTLTIRPGFESVSGKTVSEVFTASFTTAGSFDNTPPTILSFDPTGNETDVPLNKNIKITFSEPIDKSTIAEPFVQIIYDGNQTQPYSVSFENDNTAILNPTSDLLFATEYTIFLNQAVQDLAGNDLARIGSDFTTTNQAKLPTSFFDSWRRDFGGGVLSTFTLGRDSGGQFFDLSGLSDGPFRFADSDVSAERTSEGIKYFIDSPDYSPGTINVMQGANQNELVLSGQVYTRVP